MFFIWGQRRIFSRQRQINQSSPIIEEEYLDLERQFVMNEQDLKDLDRAVELFIAGEIEPVWYYLQPLLCLYPDSVDLMHLQALLLMRSNQWDEARAVFERALPLAPMNQTLRYTYGLLLLSLGEMPQGWLNYEWRREIEEFNHTHLSKPYWQQGDLYNKHLMVFSEQGYGDTLQFIRYVPLIKEKFHPKKITLVIPEPLRELFGPVANVDAIASELTNLKFDYYVCLLSLPRIFETTLATIPAPFNQFHISESRLTQWREKITSTKLKIGCAWFGRKEHENDHNRSMDISLLEPLFANTQAQFYSLQKDAPSEIFSQYPLIDLANHFENFADTAAAMQALDLIISVDTSLIHLAASLGKPTWVLLPYSNDWRWLTKIETSPWYPSIKLYRQTKYKCWEDVIARIVKDVAQKTG